MLAIHQYLNIDTHTSIYPYILSVPIFKFHNENESVACWCEPFLTNWQHTSAKSERWNLHTSGNFL